MDGKIVFCELEPRGMVDGGIWGVQPKEATAALYPQRAEAAGVPLRFN